MSSEQVDPAERDVLDRIAQTVRAAEPSATALLYGSRARGDARADSDWDVLVLLDGPVDERRSERIQQSLLDLCCETGKEVSSLTISRDDWNSPHWRVLPFHQNVEADGIELTPNGCDIPTVTEEEMAEARDDLIRSWLSQAWESLDDAEYAASGRRWRNCVGRLYYAAFYAVTALLVSRGYGFASHRGVQSLFTQHFGRTGAVPPGLIALYNQLHGRRLLADYSGTAAFNEAQVQPWIEDTRRFVEFIEQLIAPPPEV